MKNTQRSPIRRSTKFCMILSQHKSIIYQAPAIAGKRKFLVLGLTSFWFQNRDAKKGCLRCLDILQTLFDTIFESIHSSAKLERVLVYMFFQNIFAKYLNQNRLSNLVRCHVHKHAWDSLNVHKLAEKCLIMLMIIERLYLENSAKKLLNNQVSFIFQNENYLN